MMAEFIYQTIRQGKNLIRTFILVIVPVSAFLIGIILMSIASGKPLAIFFQDIFVLTSAPLYTGFASNIGMIVWSFAAAICFTMAYLLSGYGSMKKHRVFYIVSGFITLLLLFDDFFMFHEVLYPRFLHVESTAAYAGYAFIGVLYVIYFRSIILRSDYLLLLVSFGFFFLSIAVDEIREFYCGGGMAIILEDGFKLSGTGFWLAYFGRTGKAMMGVALRRDTANAADCR